MSRARPRRCRRRSCAGSSSAAAPAGRRRSRASAGARRRPSPNRRWPGCPSRSAVAASLVKPRRLSISSWLRSRSTPASGDVGGRGRLDHGGPFGRDRIAFRGRRPSGFIESCRSSHGRSPAHWIRISLNSTASTLAGIDRDVDAAQQFLLEAVDPGRAFEVGGAQLAQCRPGSVLDARQQRLHLRHDLGVGDLQRDLHLQEARTLAGCWVFWPRRLTSHLLHFEEGGLLGAAGAPWPSPRVGLRRGAGFFSERRTSRRRRRRPGAARPPPR